MGIIKSVASSIKSSLADQWLEIVEPTDLTEGVIFTRGKLIRRGENKKGTDDVISNGAIIHVPENTCMLLVENGKIISVSAESGTYKVDNSSSPSIFAGELGNAVFESFKRFMYGGSTPYKQEVYYVSLKEIKNIKFGTSSPIMYHDSTYDLDLQVRTHGSYSIKIVDPILFYKEVIPKDIDSYSIENFDIQYTNEFIEALQSSISKLSIDGVRISHLPSKSMELSKYMNEVLDEDWKTMRGFEIHSVGINTIVYTENSQEILDLRSKGMALSDPNARQGYVQGSIARGFENAGKNESGSTNAFMGMGIGMNSASGIFSEMSKSNQDQINESNSKIKDDYLKNQEKQNDFWICSDCNINNTGNFCSNCGRKKIEHKKVSFCNNCGFKFDENSHKFCQNCGASLNQN